MGTWGVPEHAPGRTPGVGALLYHQVTSDVQEVKNFPQQHALVTSGLLLRGIRGGGVVSYTNLVEEQMVCVGKLRNEKNK